MTIDPGQTLLERYGVLGMRWGVRKQRDGSVAKTGSGRDKTTGYEPKNPGTKAGKKLTDQMIAGITSNKGEKTRSEFFGSLARQQYDAISNWNDRKGGTGTQGPLIIIESSKTLGDFKSVKLSKDDLQRYSDVMGTNKQLRKRKDLSTAQR